MLTVELGKDKEEEKAFVEGISGSRVELREGQR